MVLTKRLKLIIITAVLGIVLIAGGVTTGVLLLKQSNSPALALTGYVYLNDDGLVGTSSNYDWRLTIYYESSTATDCRLDAITRRSGSTATTITIPSSVTIGGAVRTITTMKNGASSSGVFYSVRNYVENVVLPNTITEIGDYTFYNCAKISNITLPNNLTTIGSNAFGNCSILTTISTISANVTNIDPSAFSGCINLTNLNIDPNNQMYLCQNGVIFNKDLSTLIFYLAGNTGSYTIPSTVKTVGEYAFYNCINLIGITISSNVTSIGEYAFYGCTNISTISIPSGVTQIESYVFYGCTNLTNITLPESITSIGRYAFRDCVNLANFTFPSNLQTIGDYAFYNCTSFTTITIPASVTSLSSRAFVECENLTNINIDPNSKSYSSLEGIVFNKDQTTITIYPSGKSGSYKIPSTVTIIGSYAFYNCSNLTSITIPTSVTRINSYAFYGCGLSSVTIPANVTNIESYAFRYCEDLSSVTFRCNITSSSRLGSYSFADEKSYARYYFYRVGMYNLALSSTNRFTTTNFYYRGPVITVKTTTGGTAKGGGNYDEGTIATLTASANTGYHFVNWTNSSGTVLSTSATYEHNVSGSATITANFAGNTYAVTLNKQSGTGGTDNITATYGSAMPSATKPTRAGYVFQGYYTQPNGQGKQYYTNTMASANNWTETNVNTLYAFWSINTFTVNITASPSEYGTVSGGGTIGEGGSTTITATALDGYMFLYWVDNNSNIVSYESSYTFTPTSDVTYTAIFADYFAIHDGNDFITTYTKYYDANRMELIVLIEPPTNTYITAISFDNVNFYELDSWEGKVYLNCPFAMSVTYAISEGNNKLGLTFNYAERDNKIDIYVTTSSVGYDGLKTYTNSVLGVAVSATKGGTVSIIGDEYENLEDDALITCIAKVSMKNYEFVGWYNANDMETCISTSESTSFPKSQIIDSQIVAVFQQIDNGNINEDVNN